MNERLKLATAVGVIALLGLAGCQREAAEQTGAAAPEQAAPVAAVAAEPVALGSGLELDGFDQSVRPQDDLFDYVNGKWVAETPLPADRARWGSFHKLMENAQKDVRTLVEEVSAAENVEPGSAAQKIRDYYNAYMDSEKPNALGVEAIRVELDQIAGRSIGTPDAGQPNRPRRRRPHL